ncbi:MAG TPA: hypothetical protein VHF23_07165 [Gaiellaceae bacterium]|nr:hypothetical protein [Gaiellaceae bacterium]
MDRRQERFARNESLFREVNERIADVSRRFGIADELEFLCECGRADCLSAVAVTRADYEEIRAEPDRFLVARGHEHDDIEIVLEHRDDYSVVQKVGEAGELAVASDPRS